MFNIQLIMPETFRKYCNATVLLLVSVIGPGGSTEKKEFGLFSTCFFLIVFFLVKVRKYSWEVICTVKDREYWYEDPGTE